MEDLLLGSTSESGHGEGDDEFYEKIEAPKFVDFTLPSQPLPDDRAWFCLRVGCDQKHEEGMDPDTIYKNFVLRVMAARSPNVKLGRALSKHIATGIPKCPLSAPPKSSRVPRLPVMSSISHNHGVAKVKVTHISSKFKSTSANGKLKPSSTIGRSLTTPRNKGQAQNIELFRSVRNPKAMTLMPKNREVVKALVFTSPVKEEKLESRNISTSDICNDKKKLKIRRQTKCVPSRYASTYKQPKPLSKDCNVKSKQAKNSTVPEDSGGKKCRLIKKKVAGKGNLKKCDATTSGPRSEVNNDRKVDVEEKGSGTSKQCNNSTVPKDFDAQKGLLVKNKMAGKGNLKKCDATTSGPKSEVNNDRKVDVEEKGSGTSNQGNNSTVPKDFDAQKGLLIKNKMSGKGNLKKTDVTASGPKSEVNNDRKADVDEKRSGRSANVKDARGEERLPAIEETSPKEITRSGTDEKSVEEELVPVVKVVEDSKNMVSSHVEGTYTDSSSGLTNATKDDKPLLTRENMESLDSHVVIEEVKSVACQTNRQVLETETVEIADKENASASECNRNINFNSERSKKPLKEGTVASNQGGRLKKTKPTNPKPFRLRTDERSILKEANLEERRRLHQSLGPSDNAPHSKINKGYPNDELRVGSTYPKSAGSKEPKAEIRALQRMKMEGKKKPSQQTQSNAVKPGGLKVAAPSSNSVPKDTEAATTTRSVSRGKRPPTIPKEPVFHEIHVPKSCTKSQI